MSLPKKPKEWLPEYSPNFVVGHCFLYHALVAVTEAFMRVRKP